MLLANRIITPDGTVLQSFHTHDYKTHVDAVTGETYMIDGGLLYSRGSINIIPAIGDYATSEDSPEHIRERFYWGTCGITGKEPLRYKPLKDLDTDHIEAILETQKYLHAKIQDTLLNELAYRKIEEKYND